MKLALGTVQFGLDYGISNSNGKVPLNQVEKILSSAHHHGIDTLDTASAYGCSEKVLGRLLPQHPNQFKLMDKIPHLQTHDQSILASVEQSLRHLGVQQLEGLMLHHAADLTDETYAQLQAVKQQGLVNKIGISVYDPNSAITLSARYPLDLVQLPLNLFDQRFITSGCIELLHQRNVEIHARSLFLQGLLLMQSSALGPHFVPYIKHFERLHRHCRDLDIDLQTAALTIAHQQTLIDKFVIGVCSAPQLEQVVNAYQKAADTPFDIADFASHEEKLINPFLWPQRNEGSQ